MNYFFTADPHFGHKNIIKYSNRPFKYLKEMDEAIIKRHNEIVAPDDVTIIAGDISFHSPAYTMELLKRLNGTLILLRGSHDKWMDRTYHEMWEKTIEGQHVVVCHYCMRTWPRSHYQSWMLYAHSHGTLPPPTPYQLDIGVDTNNFYPYSWEQVKEKLRNQIQSEVNRKIVTKGDYE